MIVLVGEDHGVWSLDAVVAHVELVVRDVVENEGGHYGEVCLPKNSVIRVLSCKDATHVKSGGSMSFEVASLSVC